MLKQVSLLLILLSFSCPSSVFAEELVPFAKAPDTSKHLNFDFNYSSGKSDYTSMPDGDVQRFSKPSLNTAQNASLTIYNFEDDNLLLGGSINLLRLKFENDNQTKDYLNLDFVSLNVMLKWFPFSNNPRWFYLLGGFGFTGGKGKASVNSLEYELKGFGGDLLIGAGFSIPVTNWLNLNLGVQTQANIVTDMLVPFGGAGTPLLNVGFGLSF